MEVMENKPLVSVIMPLYNAQAYVEMAIHSVENQTMEDWELIVIDDCSSDSSYEFACAIAKENPRICVLQNENNCGVAKTRNRGIEMAKGDYIAFLDSDDAWYPEKLQKQLDIMARTGAAIAYCSYGIVDASGQKVKADYLVPERVSYEELLKQNYILCSAMLIKAELVKKYKFNTEFYHEDYVLGLDILKDSHLSAGCSEVLLVWRYLENSRSFNKVKSGKNRWEIYRRYLKLPVGKCVWLFLCYAAAGVRKYGRKA